MSEERSTPIAVKDLIRSELSEAVDKAIGVLELDDDGNLKVKEDCPESKYWTVVVTYSKEARRFREHTLEAADVCVPTDENSTYVFSDEDDSVVACFAAKHVISVTRCDKP